MPRTADLPSNDELFAGVEAVSQAGNLAGLVREVCAEATTRCMDRLRVHRGTRSFTDAELSLMVSDEFGAVLYRRLNPDRWHEVAETFWRRVTRELPGNPAADADAVETIFGEVMHDCMDRLIQRSNVLVSMQV